MNTKTYIDNYLKDSRKVLDKLSKVEFTKVITEIVKLKKRQGRLFIIGVGGSSANCSHAVNDFRKICGIETYAPTDNVAELTARTNDDGWETVFSGWLKTSRLNKNDAILVFSVGGGNLEKNISTNIVSALKFAQEVDCTILGIVSRDGGYTHKVAHASILIPVISDETITPFAEAFQALIWHGIVNYPTLKQ